MLTMTAEKEELCRRISLLPDDMTATVFEFLNTLEDYDDEPLTDDELAQIEASKADIAAGRVYPWEEVKRRLAELP